MIPRGLSVAVGAGMLAGVVFGLLFADFDTTQLEFVEGPSVSIVTEGTDFKMGDKIQIKLINSGTIPLMFPDESYGLRIVQLDGIELYLPPSGQNTRVLEPGKDVLFVWDQLKNDGDAVLHGTYKIVTNAVSIDGSEVSRSIVINIFK